MNKQKGFTIIELIVVIAIIAVLAGIVLVNVTSYINKGKNAAIRGNLSSATTNAATYFDTTSAGTGALFVATAPALAIKAAVENTNIGSTAVFGSSSLAGSTSQWCMCALFIPTADVKTFCVDGSGNKVEYASGACSTHCTTGANATDGVCK